MDTQREREQGLLAWQWALYRDGHGDRANLAVHAATVPLFQLGTLAVAGAAIGGGWLAGAGLGAMAAAVAAQGATHRREAQGPAPFHGPLDFVRRLFAEQWITFPRFVASGEFARAWRRAGWRVTCLTPARLRAQRRGAG